MDDYANVLSVSLPQFTLFNRELYATAKCLWLNMHAQIIINHYWDISSTHYLNNSNLIELSEPEKERIENFSNRRPFHNSRPSKLNSKAMKGSCTIVQKTIVKLKFIELEENSFLPGWKNSLNESHPLNALWLSVSESFLSF